MEIDAPTQPAGELGGCLRRPVCAPARRTARGLSWSTLAYFCVIVKIFQKSAHKMGKNYEKTVCLNVPNLRSTVR